MKSFLWSGSDMRTTEAKVAWDQVCLPKKEGGLGIKRITEWNKIALLKHIWNLCNDLDGSIWSTWIRSNLLRGRNFWTIKTPQNCSWAWGKILKLRSLAWPKMKYIIGDGMTTLYGLIISILTAHSRILTGKDSSMIQVWPRTRR
jgi:hypothetical protein